MSLTELQSRFREVQRMQDNFLHRIREFKRSEDPSILPEIEEADRLEHELLQIADQLSPANTKTKALNEADEDVPLTSGSDSRTSVSHVEEGSSEKNRSRTSLRQFALLLPPTIPDQNTVGEDVLLVDQPVSPLSERRRSLVVPSEEKPAPDAQAKLLNDIKEVEVIDSFATSPSGRRRKTTPGMFLIVKDASEVVLEEKTPPVQVEEPTFGQLMKSIVSSRELLVATPESDDAMEIPPLPAEDKTLIYISPTPPASPPLLVPCINPPIPSVAAEELPGTFHKPPPVLSPLLRSNERRNRGSSGASVKFWNDVRANREKADQVLLLLTKTIELQAAFRKDAFRIRVRPFGITGEYLFRAKNSKNMQEIKIISSESPEPLIQIAPVEIPLLPQRRKFTSRYLSAILAIQRWYKRWALRRKETLAMTAGTAEVDAVETRAASRKRRGDRRKNEIKLATDWMNISPLSPQKETS